MNNRIIEYQKQWGLGNMQVFSYGNTKLPKHTLIVNLTSATNCPSEQLGFCKCNDICYAKKCERIYKAYKNKNIVVESQMQQWTEDDIKGMLDCYITNAPLAIKYVRLNEAGDFFDQQTVNRWSNISNWLFEKFNIKTYCYTCRGDLNFDNVSFSVNSSTSNIKSADRWFFCIDKKQFDQLPKKSVTCKGNCRLCKLCYDSNYHGIIYCRQH